MSEMGLERVYEGGRSTKGWKKGAHIRSLDVLPNGTLIIDVSHNFQSENLAIITEQRPHLPGVWAKWALPKGVEYGKDVFSIHEFELKSKYDYIKELFLAIPDTRVSVESPSVLVLEMAYPDYEPGGNQSTISYVHEIAYPTKAEAEKALGDVNEELLKMDEMERTVFRVYLRNEDAEEEDAVETLRNIAGYLIYNESLKDLQADPYWGQFSEEALLRYQEEGSKLA